MTFFECFFHRSIQKMKNKNDWNGLQLKSHSEMKIKIRIYEEISLPFDKLLCEYWIVGNGDSSLPEPFDSPNRINGGNFHFDVH